MFVIFSFSTKSKKVHFFVQSKTVQIFSRTYSETGTGLFGEFKSLNGGRIMKQIAGPYNTLEANKNAAKAWKVFASEPNFEENEPSEEDPFEKFGIERILILFMQLNFHLLN